ncbi:hypothetical protein F4824DRAFT_504610 [Ustulina deusta]|nr:hypothetical protein F4824DRAFT_504610 [Ustulina deusta]
MEWPTNSLNNRSRATNPHSIPSRIAIEILATKLHNGVRATYSEFIECFNRRTPGQWPVLDPLAQPVSAPSPAWFENANERRSLVDAPNKVPQYQRFYQQAYKQHTRLWQINPRSPKLMVPYTVLLWGTLGASLYMMGRKVFGYNTWFGKA